MACSRGKKWYIVSLDNKHVWGRNAFRECIWLRKYKGTHIVVFSSLAVARKTAKTQGGVVAYLSPSIALYFNTKSHNK